MTRATIKLRVATNNTVKMRNRRTQGFWKNFSCPFVTSRDINRPPKLRINIINPIKYGFALNAFANVSNGLRTGNAAAVIPPAIPIREYSNSRWDFRQKL